MVKLGAWFAIADRSHVVSPPTRLPAAEPNRQWRLWRDAATWPRRGSALRLWPESLARQAGALRQRSEFRPDDVRIDGGLTNPGAVTAIASGDDIFAADQFGVIGDPVRDHFGMFDEIRLRLDDARNQHLALGQLHLFEHGKLMRMPGIRCL